MAAAQSPGARADQGVRPSIRLPIRDAVVLRIGGWPRDTRRGRGPRRAGEAESGATRSTGGPRESPPAPPRSGNRYCRRPPRAPVPEGWHWVSGKHCCEAERSGVKSSSDRRHTRRLERPRGHHNVFGADAGIVEVDDKRPVLPRHRTRRAAQLHRELERRRVGSGRYETTSARVGIAVAVAGERQPGEAVVATRCKQGQRVPAIAPGGPDQRRPASRMTKRRPWRARKYPGSRAPPARRRSRRPRRAREKRPRSESNRPSCGPLLVPSFSGRVGRNRLGYEPSNSRGSRSRSGRRVPRPRPRSGRARAGRQRPPRPRACSPITAGSARGGA